MEGAAGILMAASEALSGNSGPELPGVKAAEALCILFSERKLCPTEN